VYVGHGEKVISFEWLIAYTISGHCCIMVRPKIHCAFFHF
jgi:hypothetical protein